MEKDSKKDALLIYKLTFGNCIAKKGEQPAILQLVQGDCKDISSGEKKYRLVLYGVKVNRKIYQPTEIEAELDIAETVAGTTGKETGLAPNFSDVRVAVQL